MSERALVDHVGTDVVGGGDDDGGSLEGGLPCWLAWAVAAVAVAVLWSAVVAVLVVAEVPWFVGLDGLAAAWVVALDAAVGDEGCPVGS